jgi:phage terminase Nu1 subunit (DNA packaging protein)
MPSVAVAHDDRDDERLLVNKRELARQVLKCSLPTVNDLIERYPDFPIEHRGSNGVEWQFDAAAVVAFLGGKREAESRDSAARAELFRQFTLPIDSVAGDEAKGLIPSQRAALARARIAERKLAVESGFLLETSETRQVLQSAIARLARFLDGLPGEIGRQFNLPDEISAAMRSRIDERREQFVADLQAFLSQDEMAP